MNVAYGEQMTLKRRGHNSRFILDLKGHKINTLSLS